MPGGYDIYSRQMLEYYKELFRVREGLGQLRRHLRILVSEDQTTEATEVRRIRRSGLLSVHDYWRFVGRNRERVAVTGSLALAAFGLVDKRITNVDLVHLGGELSGRVRSVELRLWPEDGHELVRSGGYLFERPLLVLLRKVDMALADRADDRHLDDIMQAGRRIGAWPQ